MNSIYHSLPSVDSIRLLHLQPGVDYEPVAYSLIVIDKYKSAPEYNALSYCWGDANDTTDSFCNGISHPITKSLHAALYYIRRKALPQLIWADAVCINQMNIPERNQQVSIMPQIYQCASRILIWAGHGDEHSTSAISVIRTIGHECCMELYGPSPFPASWLAKLHRETNRTQVVSKTNLTELKNVSQTDRAPFWRFYNSAWFSRVWVIQEVERNPQIHLLCGNEEIEWDFVALAANWVNHVYHRNLTIHWRKSHFPSFGGFHNAFFMWDRSLSTRREAPFPALLNLVRHFDATDSRDKVFALLQHSISQIQTYDLDRNVGVRYPPESPSGAPTTHLGFQADYKMTTLEVYRRVALDSIRCYRNLEVLCYARRPMHADDPFPSWVPSWGVANNFNNYLPLLPFLFDAAGATIPGVQLTSNENILILQGLNLGNIVEVDDVLRLELPVNCIEEDYDVKNRLMVLSRTLVQDLWQEDISLENTAERAYKHSHAHFADFSSYLLPLLDAYRRDCYISLCSIWCTKCLQFISNQRQPTSEPSKLYTCLTCDYGNFDLCTSCYDSGVRCKNEKHTLRCGTATSFWCPYTDHVVNPLKAHADTGDGDRFFDIARAASRTRIVFMRTSQGWRGVGPMELELGDILVVLFGSRVPFILRQFQKGYRIVGDCYVHGLMDGEAVQMWKDGRRKAEGFVIH